MPRRSLQVGQDLTKREMSSLGTLNRGVSLCTVHLSFHKGSLPGIHAAHLCRRLVPSTVLTLHVGLDQNLEQLLSYRHRLTLVAYLPLLLFVRQCKTMTDCVGFTDDWHGRIVGLQREHFLDPKTKKLARNIGLMR